MSGDVAAIEALIAAQFRSLEWTATREADWKAFADAFVPGAVLHPAARPLRSQTLAQFEERMRGLRDSGRLADFAETPLGCRVQVFGNVAVALAGCEMLENGTKVTRDVSAFLLVRDSSGWKIAAQAWDLETEERPIPDELRARRE